MQSTFEFEKVYQEILAIEDGLRTYRTWTEEFEDEETHEIVPVERFELIAEREPNAEEKGCIAELEACILCHMKELSDEQLQTMFYRSNKLAYLEEGMKRNLEWALEDDDEDINLITYTITSDDNSSLDAVEILIDETCKLCGLPENIACNIPMGLPYASLMQILIGEDRFTGLVEKKERNSESLALNCTCTTRCIQALADALENTFDVKVIVSMGK